MPTLVGTGTVVQVGMGKVREKVLVDLSNEPSDAEYNWHSQDVSQVLVSQVISKELSYKGSFRYGVCYSPHTVALIYPHECL